MGQLTLFATDGERSAIIVGNQMLMGVDKVAIACDVDRGTEVNVNFSSFVDPMIPLDEAAVKAIRKALWNETGDD